MADDPTEPPKDPPKFFQNNRSKKITTEHKLRAYEALTQFGKDYVVLRDMLVNAGVGKDDVGQLVMKAFEEAHNANLTRGPIENLDPIPLFPEPRKLGYYPITALGPILSQAAKAIANKAQVPIEIAAQSVLAYAALAAQAHADVELWYGTFPLPLYFITIAETRDRKTAADIEAGWPIHEREKELMIEYNTKMTLYEISVVSYEIGKKNADKLTDPQKRKEALEKLEKQPQPPLKAMLTSPDPTIEALFKLWPRLHLSLGLFTDEGAQFTGGYGMNKDNRMKTAAAMSGLFYSGTVKRIRATDNEITILHGRRLSIHAMIQIKLGKQFIGDEDLNDQGLLARFLVAAPATIKGTRLPQDTNPQDQADIVAYKDRILHLLRLWPQTQDHNIGLKPIPIPLSVEATILLKAFLTDVETNLCLDGNYAPITGLASKAHELAARIAGVQAVVTGQVIIDAQTMRNGIDLVTWYLYEARRIGEAYIIPQPMKDAQELLDWLYKQKSKQDNKLVLVFSLRQLIRFGPNRFRSKQSIEPLLDILVRHQIITKIRNDNWYRLRVSETPTT